MLSTTLRYRALPRYSYARALTALVELARARPEPVFQFGPLDLQAVVQSGLEVTGPDLSEVTPVLEKVPGLVQVEG